jgi:GNAT superfamily N-acetyltransferase
MWYMTASRIGTSAVRRTITMSTTAAVEWRGEIRRATTEDAETVAYLAKELAQSFTFDVDKFRANYPVLLAKAATDDACLLVAVDGGELLGYLLGFQHASFFANGPVAQVEEILVRGSHQGQGIGKALMNEFEHWAAVLGCTLVALATRRAAPFYHALGYEESATYFRKVLVSDEQAGSPAPS